MSIDVRLLHKSFDFEKQRVSSEKSPPARCFLLPFLYFAVPYILRVIAEYVEHFCFYQMRFRNTEDISCKTLDIAVTVGWVVGSACGCDVVKYFRLAQAYGHPIFVIGRDDTRDVYTLDIGFQWIRKRQIPIRRCYHNFIDRSIFLCVVKHSVTVALLLILMMIPTLAGCGQSDKNKESGGSQAPDVSNSSAADGRESQNDDPTEEQVNKLNDSITCVPISAYGSKIFGVKSDGTVIAAGGIDYNEFDFKDWSDIVAVAAGSYHAVGLKNDGTVVATGENIRGQCKVDGWSDIVAVAAGSEHTVGLKSDGTVIASGDDGNRQITDLKKWSDIMLPSASK